jgi:hypothetical protein
LTFHVRLIPPRGGIVSKYIIHSLSSLPAARDEARSNRTKSILHRAIGKIVSRLRPAAEKHVTFAANGSKLAVFQDSCFFFRSVSLIICRLARPKWNPMIDGAINSLGQLFNGIIDMQEECFMPPRSRRTCENRYAVSCCPVFPCLSPSFSSTASRLEELSRPWSRSNFNSVIHLVTGSPTRV